jgi:hypothetical protein
LILLSLCQVDRESFAIDSVEDPKEATADYKEAAKATQDKLTALKVKTRSEEIASDKWVICRRD